MGKLLNALFHEQLVLDRTTEDKSPKTQALRTEITNKKRELEKKLDETDRDLLEELTNAMYAESAHYGLSKQARGFSFGVLLMIEIFSEMDTFFEKRGDTTQDESI